VAHRDNSGVSKLKLVSCAGSRREGECERGLARPASPIRWRMSNVARVGPAPICLDQWQGSAAAANDKGRPAARSIGLRAPRIAPVNALTSCERAVSFVCLGRRR
jgi:hypothetical protein